MAAAADGPHGKIKAEAEEQAMRSADPKSWQNSWREAKLKGYLRWREARQAVGEIQLVCRVRCRGLYAAIRETRLRWRIRARDARNAWREQQLLWRIHYGIDVSLRGAVRCCRRSVVSLFPAIAVGACALLIATSWRAIARAKEAV